MKTEKKKLQKRQKENQTVRSYANCYNCGACTTECNATGSSYARTSVSGMLSSTASW